jgi:hypothetical protein
MCEENKDILCINEIHRCRRGRANEDRQRRNRRWEDAVERTYMIKPSCTFFMRPSLRF